MLRPLLTQPVAVAVEDVTVPGEGPQPDFPGKVSAEYVQGCWACCFFPVGCSVFKKTAAGPDNYMNEGCFLLFGVIPMPYIERRARLPGNNFFVFPLNLRQVRGSIAGWPVRCLGLGCSAALWALLSWKRCSRSHVLVQADILTVSNSHF